MLYNQFIKFKNILISCFTYFSPVPELNEGAANNGQLCRAIPNTCSVGKG